MNFKLYAASSVRKLKHNAVKLKNIIFIYHIIFQSPTARLRSLTTIIPVIDHNLAVVDHNHPGRRPQSSRSSTTIIPVVDHNHPGRRPQSSRSSTTIIPVVDHNLAVVDHNHPGRRPQSRGRRPQSSRSSITISRSSTTIISVVDHNLAVADKIIPMSSN
jgi:hypothetical protein